MTKITVRKNDGEAFLQISGKADISHVKRIREYFLKLLSAGYSAYHIDLSAVSEIDVSFVQLLVSFRNSIMKKKKMIIFEQLSSENIFMISTGRMGIDIQTLAHQG
jgi:anti-anti-sigma regulatory factor